MAYQDDYQQNVGMGMLGQPIDFRAFPGPATPAAMRHSPVLKGVTVLRLGCQEILVWTQNFGQLGHAVVRLSNPQMGAVDLSRGEVEDIANALLQCAAQIPPLPAPDSPT